MTMNMRMVNVDIPTVRDYIKTHGEEFPRLEGDLEKIDKAPRLSIGGFVRTLAKARAAGDFTLPREDILFFEANAPGEVIVNTTRILGYDSDDPWSFSRAEIEGRRQTQEVERFLKHYIPGFENAVLVCTGPEIGVRSSRQIKGLYTLTGMDIHTRKAFADTIAHTGYPVDIHSPDGEGTAHVKPEWGTFCNIPYRCLVTDRISNLVTVGRCISVDFEAQAAVRTTPTMGAVGQAGGIAAALAAAERASAAAVDVGSLHRTLKAQGAYLHLVKG